MCVRKQAKYVKISIVHCEKKDQRQQQVPPTTINSATLLRELQLKLAKKRKPHTKKGKKYVEKVLNEHVETLMKLISCNLLHVCECV